VNHCRRVSNEEFERPLFISMITTEFVELLVGKSVAESISTDFCSIDRIMRLFFILDP
jgi:hypothetical protein